MLQTPPVATAVPSTVVPFVSYSVIRLPASAVPLTVGVVMRVTPSVLEAPLSLAAAKTGAAGAMGAVVSMVIASAAEAALVLPAISVDLTVRLWAPEASVLLVMLQTPPVATAVPSTVVPSVSYNVIRLPASAVPATTGVVMRVTRSLLEAPLSLAAAKTGAAGAMGAVVSMVIANASEAVLVLPATSVAVTVIACSPLASALLVIFHMPPVATVEPSTVVPSVSYSVMRLPGSAEPMKVGVFTRVIPSELEAPLSLPDASNGIPGLTGAIVSIMIASAPEASLVLPAASVALTVRLCAPLASALLVMRHTPSVATVVPSSVVPSVPYKRTTLPASAVPEKTGVLMRVMPSLLEAPLSLSAANAGAGGANGAVVSAGSMKMTSGDEARLVLPAASVALTVRMCVPRASVLLVMLHTPPVATALPSTRVPLVSYKVTVLPASAVPVITGVAMLVLRSEADAPVSLAASSTGAGGATGAVVSSVSVNAPPSAPALPAVSITREVSTLTPSAPRLPLSNVMSI